MKEIRKNKWSLSLNQFMVAMLCFLAFGLTGCQDSDKKLLEKTVEGVNEKCPIVVSPEIQIAKLELEEDYLTYYFDYSEQSYMLPDEIDASLKKELANQILNAISRFSGEEKEILFQNLLCDIHCVFFHHSRETLWSFENHPAR